MLRPHTLGSRGTNIHSLIMSRSHRRLVIWSLASWPEIPPQGLPWIRSWCIPSWQTARSPRFYPSLFLPVHPLASTSGSSSPRQMEPSPTPSPILSPRPLRTTTSSLEPLLLWSLWRGIDLDLDTGPTPRIDLMLGSPIGQLIQGRVRLLTLTIRCHTFQTIGLFKESSRRCRSTL